MKAVSLVALSSLVLLCTSVSFAGTLYRYKDLNGSVVMSTTIPPEIVPKGYEVLNQTGRVLEVVPPALTDEEIKARDDEKQKQARLQREREEQKLMDEKLLKQYGTPEVAVNILKRRISSIDAEVSSRLVSIELSKKAIVKNEESAADFQRNGRAIPERFTRQIEQAQEDIVTAQNLITGLNASREDLLEEYSLIIERLVIVTGNPAPAYP